MKYPGKSSRQAFREFWSKNSKYNWSAQIWARRAWEERGLFESRRRTQLAREELVNKRILEEEKP